MYILNMLLSIIDPFEPSTAEIIGSDPDNIKVRIKEPDCHLSRIQGYPSHYRITWCEEGSDKCDKGSSIYLKKSSDIRKHVAGLVLNCKSFSLLNQLEMHLVILYMIAGNRTKHEALTAC